MSPIDQDRDRYIRQESEDELPRDMAWATMVRLYPEDFTEEEQNAATQILSDSDVTSWNKVHDEVISLREQTKGYTPRVEHVGLSSKGRENLMKVALNSHHKKPFPHQTLPSKSGFFDRLFGVSQLSWLHTLSYAAVLGLALLGVWQYQEELTMSPAEEAAFSRPISDESREAEDLTQGSNQLKNETIRSPKDTADDLLFADKEREMIVEDQEVKLDEQGLDDAIQPTNKKLSGSVLELDTPVQIGSVSRGTKKAERRSKPKRRRSNRRSKMAKSKAKSKSPLAKKRISPVQTSSRRTDKRAVRQKKKTSPPRKQDFSALSDSKLAQRPSAPPPPPQPKTQADREEVRTGGQVLDETKQQVSEGVVAPSEEPVETSLAEASSSSADELKPSGPPPPWNDAIELWAQGKRQEALVWLIDWIEKQRFHRQRSIAIRLANSWARILGDQVALERIERARGADSYRKSRKRRSKPSADQQNYMEAAPPSSAPNNSMSF